MASMVRGFYLCTLLLLSACASLVPAPTVAPASTVAQDTEPRESWARVLNRFVDQQGRIDFAGLSHDRMDLDRYVAWINHIGPNSRPELFPSRASVLAYHLNAYNALAMHAILDDGVPESLAGLKKLSFFVFKHVTVGGQSLSLRAYENDVIRPLGEPRVHFALNCMAVGCPRLPRQPFSAEQLEAQLEQETRYFFSEARNVRVDETARTVYLSEILDFYSKDFLSSAESLPAYVNRYRITPVPEGYSVKFIPYDWTVNRRRPGQ